VTDPAPDDTKPKATRKPPGDHLLLTAFTINAGAIWNQECYVASMPAQWVDRFQQENRKQAHVQDGWSLPTRGLIELLAGVDPAIINVHWDMTSETFLVAFAGADTQVLTAAIAAWATTEITADVDWFDELDHRLLIFTKRRFNVLEHTVRPNGTAAAAGHVYQMLPTFLAKHIADQGLALLGRPRQLILGPPQRDNRRDIVLWPPVKLDTDESGPCLATAKITFHVETVPNHPQLHVHADLSMSRFPLSPVTYVPARGDGPPGATLWLHAPEGFLREHEPHTLLAAPIRQVWKRGDGSQWQWKPGLGRALAHLTHLPFPAPAKVLAQPAAAADEGAIRAFVLYSEGTKSQAADNDDPADHAGEPQKSKSLLHAAKNGFVPGDHLEVHRRIAGLVEPLGIAPITKQKRIGSRAPRKITLSFDVDAHYFLEIRTHNELTREALTATLEHHYHLIRADDRADPNLVRYTGAFNITVRFIGGTELATGIQRKTDDKRPESTLRGIFVNHVVRQLGDTAEPIAAILELEDDRHFARIRRIDPKTSLKKAFARSGRRLQCLRPAKFFKPPRTWPENSRRQPPTPYPGTDFARSTIHRCSAAIDDALRQLGRLGEYDIPAGLPELEHIGIWLHHDGKACVPVVVRHRPGRPPIAVLAGAKGHGGSEILYRDLPRALANGQGRIGPGDRQKALVGQFLTNVLGIGDAPDTHDRVAFVRAAGFRNWGWDWLQDRHITPDLLIRPGVELRKNPETAVPLTPADCKGLRIVRIRDRSSTMEVARGFAADSDIYAERISGHFRFSDRVSYAINPRSDQMQTPLSITKLDPDIHNNLTVSAANPVPLELCVAFKQPDDDPELLAALTARLRRAHAHTIQDTRYPSVLHLCSLADEYL
jgi:hypothetical protein